MIAAATLIVVAGARLHEQRRAAETPDPLARRVDSLRLESVPLSEAIAQLQIASSAQIDIDWSSIPPNWNLRAPTDAPTVSARLHDTTVGGALTVIFKAIDEDLIAVRHGNQIVIINSRPVLAVYDIRDLAALRVKEKPVEYYSTVNAFKDMFDPQTDLPRPATIDDRTQELAVWLPLFASEELLSRGTVQARDGLLFVFDTPRLQTKLQHQLTSIRRAIATQSADQSAANINSQAGQNHGQ